MHEPNEQKFMQAFTVRQVSEMTNIPPGTIRQWEKSLEGVLVIPRDEKGARYYTQFEIDALLRVKALRDKGVSFEVIRDILHNSEHDSETTAIASTVPAMSQSEAITAITELQQVVKQMSQRIDEIVEQRVQIALDGRLAQLEKNQVQRDSKLEERLAERDKVLMETLRALQETASANSQKRKGFLSWFRK